MNILDKSAFAVVATTIIVSGAIFLTAPSIADSSDSSNSVNTLISSSVVEQAENEKITANKPMINPQSTPIWMQTNRLNQDNIRLQSAPPVQRQALANNHPVQYWDGQPTPVGNINLSTPKMKENIK